MLTRKDVFQEIRVVDPNGQEVVRSYGWRQCRLVSAGQGPDISTQSIQLLMSILQVVFLYIVPLFVLSIFNVKLTRFLKTNANKMSKSRAPPKREDPGRQDSHNNSIKNNNNTASLRSPSMPSLRSSIVERQNTNRRTSRTTSLLIAMAGSYAALWFPFTLITFLLDFDLVNNVSQLIMVLVCARIMKGECDISFCIFCSKNT